MDITRHSGLFQIPAWYNVVLIGAGGIGALTAVTLGKMGVQDIAIYDGDDVDEVNLATQFHKMSTVGDPKCLVLANLVEEFSDAICEGYYMRIEDGCGSLLNANTVISAVDSMAARHAIWTAVKDAPKVEWYLDARMGAMEYQHYLVSLTDENAVREYEKALFMFDDENTPDVPCTEKATIFTADIAAGEIGLAVSEVATGNAQSHFLSHHIKNRKKFYTKIG